MKRHATAVWKGALTDGAGTLDSQSGTLSGTPYSFKSRFEDEEGRAGTNPEELLAAAHAGCFAMQLSHFLAENGTPAEKLEARAVVAIEQAEGGGFAIPSSTIQLTAHVPDIAEADFDRLANQAKEGCPVSRALGAITVTLEARLA